MSRKTLEDMSKDELIRELREIQGLHGSLDARRSTDPERVLHELHVHQVELEMQNRELREAQLVIEESRSKLADLYDFAPVGYCTIDSLGTLREINLTGSSLLSQPRERLLGQRLANVAALTDKQAVRRHLEHCTAGEPHVTTELPLWTRSQGHVLLQMVSIPSGDGGTATWRTVLSDVTAAKALERRLAFLAEAGEKLGAFLDYASTAATAARLPVPSVADLCILDAIQEDDELRRLEVVFADPNKQVKNAGILHLQKPDADSPVSPARVIASGEAALFPDLPRRTASRSVGELDDLGLFRGAGVTSLMIVPLCARGRAIGALTFASLDSARRFTRDDLLFAEDFGNRAAIALDNARLHAQAQSAVRARDSLLALVSHDLRTPLGVVLLKTETMLRSGELHAETPARKSLLVIRRAAQRMQRLIADLLDVASIEASHLAIEPEDHPIAALAGEVLEALAELAAQKSVRLTGHVPPGGGARVRCDRERILQVLTNLIENAIKFSPEGATVTLRAAAEGGLARFSVADAGPGIAAAHLRHIFDRFWQAPATARLGTGLGLAIARGIVEAHGGQLWVESLAGEGATFFFTLPLGTQVSDPAVVDQRAPGDQGGPHPSGERPRHPVILVVDDDADAREALGEILEHEGFTVATASNGAEALDYLRAHPAPCMVLLDLTMPVLDGWGFLAERNAEPALRAIPVIVLSGLRDVAEKVTAANAAYLAKPVRPDKLLKLIDQHCAPA